MRDPVPHPGGRVVHAGRAGRTFRRPGPAGFSLVEVLVGLLVLELGLLGVAGLVAVSGRLLAGAARTERALFVAEEVMDSLAASGEVSEGERTTPEGTLRWRFVSDDGEALPILEVAALDGEGRAILTLHALMPEFPAAEETE